jgi:hypothetical protein
MRNQRLRLKGNSVLPVRDGVNRWSLKLELRILNRCGTGSCPHPPQGWQRQMRFNASQAPGADPWVLMASKAYSEQLGVKRHWLSGPNRKIFAGDNVQRYSRTNNIRQC